MGRAAYFAIWRRGRILDVPDGIVVEKCECRKVLHEKNWLAVTLAVDLKCPCLASEVKTAPPVNENSKKVSPGVYQSRLKGTYN